jgi:hypothetical protein
LLRFMLGSQRCDQIQLTSIQRQVDGSEAGLARVPDEQL